MSFVDSCIKKFLINRIHLVKETLVSVPKKELFIVLPYLGSVSLQTRTRLEKLFKKSLPSCHLKVVFRSTERLSSIFRFKDRLPRSLVSGVVYKFLCSSCNATYIGKSS